MSANTSINNSCYEPYNSLNPSDTNGPFTGYEPISRYMGFHKEKLNRILGWVRNKQNSHSLDASYRINSITSKDLEKITKFLLKTNRHLFSFDSLSQVEARQGQEKVRKKIFLTFKMRRELKQVVDQIIDNKEVIIGNGMTARTPTEENCQQNSTSTTLKEAETVVNPSIYSFSEIVNESTSQSQEGFDNQVAELHKSRTQMIKEIVNEAISRNQERFDNQVAEFHESRTQMIKEIVNEAISQNQEKFDNQVAEFHRRIEDMLCTEKATSLIKF